MLTTTLERLRDNNACERGYDLIAEHVGVDFKGAISLETILDNNGIKDCIWSLRASDGGKEVAIEFSIRVAMTVYKEPLWTLWATNWLDSTDRNAAASYAAVAASYATRADDASYAARAAFYAADAVASYAADAADDAFYAASYAARADAADAAASSSFYAADAGASAAVVHSIILRNLIK